MGEKIGIVATILAILTLMGGIFVWVYSEMKPITELQAIEFQRKEWLTRWMDEREKRLISIEKRIERLEEKELKNE